MNTTCPVLTDALLDRLRALSASFCLAEGGSHGPDHSERVLQTALTLGRRMGARLEILAPAALLHDIGRREESQSRGRICHAERGAELAAPLLPELGYSVAEVAAICHCIRAHRYRGAMAEAGFTLLDGEHPIIPVMLGDAKLAQDFAARALELGVYVIGFSFPVVPRGQARIRTQMSAAHTFDQIDRTVAAFTQAGRELGVI